jgi:kinesin family protein 4/21/27
LIGRELRDGANRRTCITTEHNSGKLQINGKEFAFDNVFGPETDQVDLYRLCSKNQILGCFDGYNATILAYGQTGSGKTHTMGTGSTIGLA